MKIRKNNDVEQARRIFTDREEPRAAFWSMYDQVCEEMTAESCVHVLTYYGIGGIGKSSLLKKLMTEMDERLEAPKYTFFDFDISQKSRTVLDRMKNKLADQYKFVFPLFEVGSYVYAMKVGEKPDSFEVKQLTEKSKLLSLLVSAVGSIPVVGIAAQVLDIVDQGVAYFRNRLKQHSRLLIQIEQMEPEELYRKLPYLFAQDMVSNLEGYKEPFVIFLDTYERVVNELSQSGDALLNDMWIRGENGLVQNIPNVVWVIAGREKLKWEQFDAEWSEALEQHILGALSPADSDTFLTGAGIGNKELREQIYALTKGTPVYLDLCVDQYFKICEDGIVPEISMFGKNTRDLIERFVRYMGDAQKDLTYMLACLGRWDDRLISRISTAILPNFSLSAYEKAKDFSFVIPMTDDTFSIHQTVSGILMEYCPAIIKKQTGQGLLDTFSGKVEKESAMSATFGEAILYITRAGMLLHQNDEELYEFYTEHVSQAISDMAYMGRFETVEAVLDLIMPRAELNKEGRLYACILYDKADLYNQRGEYKRAKKWSIEALELHTRLLGEMHEDTLTAESLYARVLESLGEDEQVLEIRKKVYEAKKRTLGAEHPETLLALDAVAVTLDILWEDEKAKEIHTEVLEKIRRIRGEDHPDTVLLMGNLAYTLDSLEEYEEARDLQELVIEKRSKLLGENHPDTIHTIGNQAMTLMELGEYENALEMMQKVLDYRKETVGEDHPATVLVMLNMASVYKRIGENEKVLHLFQQAMEKYLRFLGEDHPDTMNSVLRVGEWYFRLEEYEKAQELYQRYLEKAKDVLGIKNMSVAMAMHNLAEILYKQEAFAEAKELYQQESEITRSVCGEESAEYMFALESIGMTCFELEEFDTAVQLKQQVLKWKRKELGDEHPETLWSMKDLAEALLYVEFKENDVQEMYRKAMDAYLRVYGEEHPETLDVMLGLSRCLLEMGELDQAKEMGKKVMDAYLRISGEDDADTIFAIYHLANIEHKKKQYDAALELYRKSLENSIRFLGKNDPQTVDIMTHMSDTLYALGAYEEALKLREESLEKYRKNPEKSNVHLFRLLVKMEKVLEAMGKWEDVLRYRYETLETLRLGDAEPDIIRRAMHRIAETYEKLGEMDQASEWRRNADESET